MSEVKNLNENELKDVNGGIIAPWDDSTPKWHLRCLYYLSGVFQNEVYGSFDTEEQAEEAIPDKRAQLSSISATGVNVFAEKNG